jgi:hypothetical protein
MGSSRCVIRCLKSSYGLAGTALIVRETKLGRRYWFQVVCVDERERAIICFTSLNVFTLNLEYSCYYIILNLKKVTFSWANPSGRASYGVDLRPSAC